MDESMRIGRVSSVDYEKGLVSVTYPDRNDNTTALLPVLSNGRYRMPAIGELVLVAHLTSGPSAGVVLGTITNEAQGIRGAAGTCILDLQGGTVTVASGSLRIADGSGGITVAEILAMKAQLANHESRISALEAAI